MIRENYIIILIFCLLFPDLQENQRIIQSSVDRVNVTSYSHSSSKNNQDQAKCICDIQYNLCDLQCCCDSQCNSQQISFWKQNKVCSKENQVQFSETKFPQCKEWRENPQSQDFFYNQVNTITCVMHDNLPYQGHFFNLDENHNIPTDNDIVNSYKQTQQLEKDDQARDTVYVGGKSLLIQKSGIKITIPSVDVFGSCNNETPIKFSTPYKANCIHKFILQEYKTQWKTDIIQALKDILKTPSDLQSNLGDNFQVLQTPLKDIEIIKNRSDQTKCSLVNALKKIEIKFYTNGNTIERGTVDFEDISINNISCQESINLSVDYQVDFIESATQSNSNDDLFIQISGTPGYVDGKQLFIGEMSKFQGEQEQNIIDQYKSGFSIILSDYNGDCLHYDKTSNLKQNQQARKFQQNHKLINFGEDITIQCNLKLNQQQCLGNENIDPVLITNLFQQKSDNEEIVGHSVIGRYGTSDYYIVEDWISVKESSYWEKLQTNSKYCQQSSTSILTVFYAKSGAIGNEQNYIVKTQIGSPPNNIWKWNNNGPNQQNFQYSLQVVFVKVDYTDLYEKKYDEPGFFSEWINKIFQGIQD